MALCIFCFDGSPASAQVGKALAENCPNPSGWRPTPEELQLIAIGQYGESLCGVDLSGVDLAGADMSGIDLSGAILSGVNLSNANLFNASLFGAELFDADLTDANLFLANLSQANLNLANLRGAHLYMAALNGANLKDADLTDAVLMVARMTGAELSGAILRNVNAIGASLNDTTLVETDLTDARLSRADLTGAQFEPVSAPATGYLTDITGLTTLRFEPGHQGGLVALSKAFQQAGLGQPQREVTYALWHWQTRHAINGFPEDPDEGLLDRFVADPGVVFEGIVQLVFLEWTTAWGLHPGRAMVTMLGLMAAMTLVYAIPIARPPRTDTHGHGIFKVWPRGRLEPRDTGIFAADDTKVERLQTGVVAALPWALYYSVLSTFHFGWRGLNIGTWLTRMQLRDFGLRGRGWPRLVSGIQSLISMYLLAIWILTYFSRPFD